MASYQGHLAVSAVLGAAYGGVGVWQLNLDWGPVFLGGGMTALGGLLPDLDSDSGVPVRELFGVTAAVIPGIAFMRLHDAGLSLDQTLVILAAIYVFIRYGLSAVFKRFTVHRGMFHSIPAMLIVGLAVFLVHPSDPLTRLYVAGGTMLGFLSHLVLDELYSIDFMGHRLRLNKFAGSALKFFSPSWVATGAAYALLAILGWMTYAEFERPARNLSIPGITRTMPEDTDNGGTDHAPRRRN